MKKTLLLFFLFFAAVASQAQIIVPAVKAGFGVDADLRAKLFNNATLVANDDWFPGNTTGNGTFIIDTNGAASLLKRYAMYPPSRKMTLTRRMRFPQFSVINNRLLIDGIFVRDFHGDDSTVFASGSNKNGMSPADWTTPTSQGIPDKNDILDAYLHIRRDGMNFSDSLWVFGGISIQNITGNRYFDFEMYQTDITYDRTNLKFTGYGPDAGHTAWKFDAQGKVIQPGDVIFTAEYDSKSLSFIEARIWVDTASLRMTPYAFKWGGSFVGASSGSKFGYASIMPLTPGDYYTGLQSAPATWAGTYGVVYDNDTVSTTYTERQFMEFSVNLTKLGIDPFINSNQPCKMPFNQVLVKSRASTSFSAELKDFVGPFSFSQAPKVDVSADFPILCGSSSISTIYVNNPVPTSIYNWTTPDGNIVSETTGTYVTVNKPGKYIVTQELMSGCGSNYASDTITIVTDNACMILKSNLKNFKGQLQGTDVVLQWTIDQTRYLKGFEIERSLDNKTFTSVGKKAPMAVEGDVPYIFTDDLSEFQAGYAFYRLKINDASGQPYYSKVVAISRKSIDQLGIELMPNPVNSVAYLTIHTDPSVTQFAEVVITNNVGVPVRKLLVPVRSTSTTVNLDNLEQLQQGVYVIRVKTGEGQYVRRMLKGR
jgi:hypothetical protein